MNKVHQVMNKVHHNIGDIYFTADSIGHEDFYSLRKDDQILAEVFVSTTGLQQLKAVSVSSERLDMRGLAGMAAQENTIEADPQKPARSPLS